MGHARKGHAAPAADLKKEKRKDKRARQKANAAGAVEVGVSAAGPALVSDLSDCSSSS